MGYYFMAKATKESTAKISVEPKTTAKSSTNKTKSMVKISASVEQTLHNKIKQYVKKHSLSINALIGASVKSYIK
jgi:hypothetical protein